MVAARKNIRKRNSRKVYFSWIPIPAESEAHPQVSSEKGNELMNARVMTRAQKKAQGDEDTQQLTTMFTNSSSQTEPSESPGKGELSLSDNKSVSDAFRNNRQPREPREESVGDSVNSSNLSSVSNLAVGANNNYNNKGSSCSEPPHPPPPPPLIPPPTDAQGSVHNNILQSLAEIHARLEKLDKIEVSSSNMEGDISQVQSDIKGVATQVSSFNTELQKYEEKWESRVGDITDRLASLERGDKSLRNKWDLHREATPKDFETVQSSIDSNSKELIELRSQIGCNTEKYSNLENLEVKIQEAAEKQFQVLQKSLKRELREELKEEMISEVESFKTSASEGINKGIKRLKTELTEEFVPKEAINELRSEFSQNPTSKQAPSPQDLQYSVLKGEAFAKRHNLLFFGIPENENVDEDRKSILIFLSERMGISNIKVHETYRLGKVIPNHQNPRPLVVKFPDYRDRWAIWSRKSSIKPVEGALAWLQEDLPKKLREDNRLLHRIAKAANQYPSKYEEVKVKDYSIRINGQKFGPGKLHLLPEELQPEQVFSPRSETAIVFFTKHSPLSNHYPCSFQIEDQTFTCVEQYLAFQKAKFANNRILARSAMDTDDPAEHKAILNQLKNLPREGWSDRVEETILTAAWAKFSQNENLANFLVETHPLQIGEASRDTFWGVGHSLESAEALDSTKWPHQGNLLGRTLESQGRPYSLIYERGLMLYFSILVTEITTGVNSFPL